MRRNFLIGLGLVASLGGGAAAQQTGGDAQRKERAEERHEHGRFEEHGGPARVLFRGITLTDAQKTQLKQVRESERDSFKAKHEEMKKQFEAARTARERGDTATAKAIMERNRQAFEQVRDQRLAAIRNILTPDQRVQFDKNVVELKQLQKERAERFGQRRHWWRRGHEKGAQS